MSKGVFGLRRKICENCGVEFRTRSTHTRGCSLKCRGLLSSRTGQQKRVARWPLLGDREWLQKRYLEDRVSLASLAKEVGTAHGTVVRALVWHKIPLKCRPNEQPSRCIVCHQEFFKKDVQRLTCSRACGTALGHQNSGPRQIQHPPPEEYSKRACEQWLRIRRQKYPLLFDRQWLTQRWVDDELTQEEIGKLVGCSRGPITVMLKQFGLLTLRDKHTERHRLKTSGPNNWHWKGGIYNGRVMGWSGGSNVRHKLRVTLIAERGEKCEWCGSVQGRITVHHLKPFRFSCQHVRENAVLLCARCHGAGDQMFREQAGKFFASANYPGLDAAYTTLRSQLNTAIVSAHS